MRAFSLAALALVCLVIGGLGYYYLQRVPADGSTVAAISSQRNGAKGNSYEVEVTDVKPPQGDPADALTDDRLEDKKPLTFDPALVDRRPLGEKGEWLVNSSAAVLRLDIPLVRPDVETHMTKLYPSYIAAIRGMPSMPAVLPSANMLDGKAKQFDDGLYAALDQAYYRGLSTALTSHVGLMRRLYAVAGKNSVAAPFLAAGLEIVGVEVEVADRAQKDAFLQKFRNNPVESKPIGFYTWNDTLATCFKFLRFFQHEFQPADLVIPLALSQALQQDAALLHDYQKMLAFYAKLTNPYISLSLTDLLGRKEMSEDEFKQLCREKKVPRASVAILPYSTSRETVLFEKLFPLGVPPNVNLMHELVRRIRSGEDSLQPGPNSGWYDYQVYALETLLLPEKGEEKDKLVLSKAYKKRMLEAFEALITKRRETHVRQLAAAKSEPSAMPPQLPDKLKPRLRVEPCPTFYLRTARSYSFLANFLEVSVGKESLQSIHGLKNHGERAQNLLAELHWMQDLFYGLYVISAQDIGLRPDLTKDESRDALQAHNTASDWLATAIKDEDLVTDTRVAVPIASNSIRNVTRLWLTLGVRMAKLEVSYVRPPSLKPAKGDGAWQVVEQHRLEGISYLIPVDEFTEVEIPGLNVLTREEFRQLCDREKTKEAIIKALQK